MKYFLVICVMSIGLAQENKNDFDPDKLNDPEPRWPMIISPLIPKMEKEKSENRTDTTQIIVEGFRVQVLATRTRDNADQLRQTLAEGYAEEIYIVFEAPNYKVRMGNFFDRKQAEKFRQTLVKKGYPSAWIIRTRIDPKIKP
jgi:cell division protein FtsN